MDGCLCAAIPAQLAMCLHEAEPIRCVVRQPAGSAVRGRVSPVCYSSTHPTEKEWRRNYTPLLVRGVLSARLDDPPTMCDAPGATIPRLAARRAGDGAGEGWRSQNSLVQRTFVKRRPKNRCVFIGCSSCWLASACGTRVHVASPSRFPLACPRRGAPSR